ncbi:hypothetical protein VM636_16770 [Streptomyces sp. SCSIO 75703]|uniref:SCO4225 family membrane protein n=1 Tax=unclassified Streptomyces TaxID=2593676 RepID=UPI0006B57840|nr:hypothetical protein [Streptomyces sp. TP-A0875]
MNTRPIRTFTRRAVTNPVSAVYLSLVGAAIVLAAAEPLYASGPDASLVWVWPALLTFPLFGFVVWLVDSGWADAPAWFFIGGIVVSALLQSFVLGTVYTSLRGRRRRHAPTAPVQ